MKTLKLAFLCSVVAIAMAVLPVGALLYNTGFSAKGEVLCYYSPYEPTPEGVPGAAVKDGDWSMKIINANLHIVDFSLHYNEMNILPEVEGGAPFGSVDQFWITEIQIDDSWKTDDGYYIYGSFNVDKLAVQPDGSKVMFYNYLGDQWGTVFLGNNGLLQVDTGYWHLIGYRTYGTGSQQGNNNQQ